MNNINKNPEQIARDKIDTMLIDAGWLVQSKKQINLSANIGVALRETNTESGSADYILFVEGKPVGVVEAKAEDLGYKLLQVEEQSARYSQDAIKIGQYTIESKKPFVYESTGTVTRFTDYRDPKPRGRTIFSFHKPETLAEWIKEGNSLRKRLLSMPTLNTTGLRPAQIVAVENLEESFKKNRPRALIQMATGAGKTFTSATFVYRLLKYANAKRILFLVDTKNLGEQAEQEFISYQPNDDNRKFTELYNVQRLTSSYIPSDSHVCISTIQRLYSILKGEELDESSELDNPEENSWLEQQQNKKQATSVDYTAKVPIEHFDFIVIDECHRSIYNLWKQVLDYFDAFLIGLTATPDKRTFGFFNENVVSEYTYEQSVCDGVNVPYDVYIIETDISQNGAKIDKNCYVDKRDKLTREVRWQQQDEDTEYSKKDLDKKVVNPSQIRTIIREYKRALKDHIFPYRINEKGEYEVPKTLIFAKTDSHADDIIKIVREEFDEGNDFCKKVTYKIDDDPKSVLNRFRNDYYPRIAVTVDMIATGTDVKPLEVLLFMRDVKSTNYFEQMKGRGTRTISSDKLQTVSRTAMYKSHFVIVDAIGVTKSKKTDSRPLERKPSVDLKTLLDAVAMGVMDEDLYLSLANRLIRLDKQINEQQETKIIELSGGKNLKQITKELISAYDGDTINELAEIELAKIAETEQTPERIAQVKNEVQELLKNKAFSRFNGELNNFIDNIRREHEQIIDTINIDRVIKTGSEKSLEDTANKLIQDFSDYLQQHKDEIKALSIFYNQPAKRKNITFKMIKEVYEKLIIDKPSLAPHAVWEAYITIDKAKGEQLKADKPIDQLTALVSLIRRVCGIDSELKAFDKTIDYNFQRWAFREHTGQHNRFTSEQMDWLRMIKEHIVSSYHIEVDDLEYTPFDGYGGIGKMYQLFGDEMNNLIDEMNEALVA